MTRRLTVTFASALVVVALIGVAPTGSAYHGSAATPDPAECTLTPRTVAELQAIYGTPAAEGAGEATATALDQAPASAALPAGVPADTATETAIAAAVRLSIACYNAGNLLASFANVTDDFIASQVGLDLFDADFVALLNAPPQPLPEGWQTSFLGVRNVTLLPDGRVAALVDYISPTPGPEGVGGIETDLWILAPIDNVWRLDQVIENLERTHGPHPVAGAGLDSSPNPEECALPPRTIADLQALYASPAAAGAGEATAAAAEQSPPVIALPVGQPANAATVLAVVSAVRSQMACYNAGNFLAAFSGTTDDFIRSQVGLDLFDADFVARLAAEPKPLPEAEQTTLLGVRGVTVLPDGRIAALVDYTSPTPQPEGINGVETDLWIFATVDGRLRLDEAIENLEGEFGPPEVAAS